MHRPGDSSRRCRLPEISRFLGIVIRMYFREHGPPHFHVLAIVVEWGSLHQAELRENWSRLRDHKDPFPIAPLA